MSRLEHGIAFVRVVYMTGRDLIDEANRVYESDLLTEQAGRLVINFVEWLQVSRHF